MPAPRFRHLPSLPALRVFEAAGRHLSFTDAAAELCVTTSAVSRQVRALESELGRPLFGRGARGLTLTKDGAAYLEQVADALRRLDQATRELRAETGGARRKLRLSVLASFAGNWLVPRLPAFERAHPDIDVAMEATTRYADFAGDPVDAAIRFGTGPWKGLHSDPLFPLEFYLVCRPGRGGPSLRTPADLAHHTWLEEVHVPEAWPLWLAAAGVPGLTPARRLTYDHAQLMLDAAMAGQGVALTSDVIAERPLRDGRLVRPFAITASAPWTYHLVTRPDGSRDPAVGAFRDWLVAEVAAWRRVGARRSPTARRRAGRTR